MSSEPKARRGRGRYRSKPTPTRCGARVSGGAATSETDYTVAIELPTEAHVTEVEMRAVELLLGNELQELLARPAEIPRKNRVK